MTAADLLACAPLAVLAASSVLTLLTLSRRSHRVLTFAIAAVALGLAALACGAAATVAPRYVTALLYVDEASVLFSAAICLAALAATLLCRRHLRLHGERPDELYLLLQLATLGALVLIAARHVASFFLGLEVMSVCLYALVAYPRRSSRAVEAALKLVVLAGTASAMLLFGFALLYATTGTLSFAEIGAVLSARALSPIAVVGLVLVLSGIAFELALVPFHMWAPDVYEGAPVPVAAYIATVSKGAMLAALLRWSLNLGDAFATPAVGFATALLAAASMLGGNLLALMQTRLLRILAYSSIAHLGYALVAIIAAGELGPAAVTLYLVTYLTSVLAAFAVVAVHPRPDPDLRSIRGFFWRRPVLGAVLGMAMLSLAGMPLTAGFVGKLEVVLAGAGAARWTLVLLLAAGSGLGMVYYLRVIAALLAKVEAPAVAAPSPRRLGPAAIAVLVAATTGVVVLGVLPQPLHDLVRAALLPRDTTAAQSDPVAPPLPPAGPRGP